MAASVQLTNVSKRFDKLEAVKELSLGVEEGEFLTLLGPSGCGKTTILRIISGFEVPDEGAVYIGGKIVNHVPPFRRNVNTVFQSYALFPHMNVFENVAYGLTLKAAPRREIASKVHDMLERVGLVAKAKRMPRELSGGEMQRIALVRALINEPRVLLLDEPLGALDAKLRHAMQLELKHMHKKLGITFILVTHDQEEALVMSDRIGVMKSGQMLQLDTPREIFERPTNRFVAEFIGTGNQLSGTVTAREGAGGKVAAGNGRVWRVAAIPEEIAVGTRVTVIMRPQKIGVYRDQGPPVPKDCNVLQATLKEIVYAGSVVRFFVDIGDGTTLQAENIPENLLFDYLTLAPGTALSLHVPAAALLLYRD
jgi:spermidine/putrescine ABC transporter ATP-binding subunit